MNVYVESNFVLELALLQEQHESCARLVDLAGRGRFRLVLPAYSLVEPYEALSRYSKKRQAVAENVRSELRQLGRSAPYEEQTSTLEELTALLIRSQGEERSRLRGTLERLLEVADLIPLTAPVIADSISYQDEGFTPQDAIVYASVLTHLSETSDPGSHVFLNRNSKDFSDPDVEDRLAEMGCKIFFRFDHGAEYIRHEW